MESIQGATNYSWSFIVFVFLLTVLILSLDNKRVKYHLIDVVYIFFAYMIALITIPFFMLRPFDVRNSLIAATLAKHITKLVGITWELRNGEVLAARRGAVIVANHQTKLERLGMYNIWSVIGDVAVIVKKQYFYMWPFGLSLWLSGTVFVDRQNPKSAYQSLEKAANLMKKDKVKLWIFPEGTYNKTDESLMPFKKGAFKIAIECQVPVIPVIFSPFYFVDEKKQEYGSGGHVVITTLPAISTVGLTMDDLDTLIATTRNAMQECYNAVAKETKKSYKL